MTRCFTALVTACFIAACGGAGEPPAPVQWVTIYNASYADGTVFFAEAEGHQSVMIDAKTVIYADGKKVSRAEFLEWFRKAWGVQVVVTTRPDSYGAIGEARFISAKQPANAKTPARPPLELKTAKTAAAKAAADPAASCGKVSVPEGTSIASGSGTVVACEGGRSLVLTNRHACPQLGAGKSFECGGKRYPAFCCCVDDRADLALLIVDAELPACVVASKCPADGTEVKQYGHPFAGPQKPKRGLIQRFLGVFRADDGSPVTRSGIGTENGDSGCGVFASGELVAVTWGAGGSCVHLSDVRRLLGVFAEKTKAFPKLGAAMRAATVEAPTPPAPQPSCPGGQCPVPAPQFRPAFRPLMLGGS